MDRLTASGCALFRAPFCFLRHGETEVNRLGLVAGQADVELNETGWQQARAAAHGLRAHGIDAIYSSPLKRARDTAACVATALGLELVVIPELAERNWGALEGKPRELRVREATPLGGEALDAFSRRTLAGLAGIRGGSFPLVVAHSGTFRVLCGALGVEPPKSVLEHARPLRFAPPPRGSTQWAIEPM